MTNAKSGLGLGNKRTGAERESVNKRVEWYKRRNVVACWGTASITQVTEKMHDRSPTRCATGVKHDTRQQLPVMVSLERKYLVEETEEELKNKRDMLETGRSDPWV